MLERWGVEQPCLGPNRTHEHQTRAEVDKLVLDGILKYMPGSNRNVAVYTDGRTWQGKDSGRSGVKAMQLISGLPGRRVPLMQRAHF
jgi:hypothetical protein